MYGLWQEGQKGIVGMLCLGRLVSSSEVYLELGSRLKVQHYHILFALVTLIIISFPSKPIVQTLISPLPGECNIIITKLLLQVYIQKYSAGRSMVKGIRQQPISLVTGSGLSSNALGTIPHLLKIKISKSAET